MKRIYCLLPKICFVLLLFIFCNTFANGWQRKTVNLGTNTYIQQSSYFPSADGGVIAIYRYGGYGIGRLKYDRNGTLLYKKIEPIYNITGGTYEADSFIIQYQSLFGEMIGALELQDGRIAVFTKGPLLDTFCLFTTCPVRHADLRRTIAVSLYDKNGNFIKTKFNTNDTLSIGLAMSGSNSSCIYNDTAQKKYVRYTVVDSSYFVSAGRYKHNLYVQKNSYDTALNMLLKEKYPLDTFTDNSSSIPTTLNIEKVKNYLFISYAKYGIWWYGGQSQPIYITDLSGIRKFKNDTVYKDNYFDNIKDSLVLNKPACTFSFPNPAYYTYSDFAFDELEHLHLFGLRIYESLTEDSCFGRSTSLVHTELDPAGNIIKKSFIDITNRFPAAGLNNIDEWHHIGKFSTAIVFPSQGHYNILIHKLTSPEDSPFDEYYYMNYDAGQNRILSFKYVENKGELSQSVWNPGQVLMVKKKSLVNEDYFGVMTCLFDDAFGFSGIFKIDSLGHINGNTIIGNVFADQNNNCAQDANDRNIARITVTAQHQNDISYTSTDNNGNYTIGIGDSGIYTVKAQPNINYTLFQGSNCPPQTFYAYLDSIRTDTLKLPLKPSILCPNMYVDISTPRLRRCTTNIYTINYRNNGTIASPNTYVDILFDRFLIVNSASVAYSSLGNNIYRFPLGNVDYLTSSSFTVNVTLNCDSTIVGQTHCVEAHIYPDTVCAASGYTGPVISATAFCKHDSVEFHLHNSGGNMQSPKHYIVIEDNLNRINGAYQLNSGQQKIVTIATANGSTYSIIAEQDDNFPPEIGDKFATAFIEGCNAVNGQFHTGFVTQYPEYDGEPYRSVDCQQSRGAYDPNKKTGYPVGVSANHTIEKNTAIDYKIDFQNTGNDKAITVVIVDTISRNLDINTIEPGASSHRYTYMRSDSNTIKFIFDSINLIDSNLNEALSHGYVKFRIQQKPNLANGNKIFNEAQIYFDYNSAIVTNRTMHTIGELYVNIISKVINPKYENANLKIYPNPFRENTTIELQNLELQKTTLTLMDITGKEILQLQSNTNQFQLDGSRLEKGIYLFKIKNEKEDIASGKLVVQ